MDDFLDLSRFTKLKKIGKGGFGKVYKIIDKNTNEVFAAKISNTELEESSNDVMILLKREININSQISHPSILTFIGYSPIDFEKRPYSVIVLEYSANGSLKDIIKLESLSLSPSDWNDTKKLINIYGIASAMAYLHAHNIIHRDIKPQNILEDDYLFPKVSDFGLSKIDHQNTDNMSMQSSTGIKGTYAYIPPELYDTKQWTKEGDVYSFGLVVYEILTLNEPFKDETPFQIMKKVCFGERPEFNIPIEECYKNLIERCWSQKPEDRPSFEEIVEELKTNSDFITNLIDEKEFFDYIDLIDNLGCSFDPSKKISIYEKKSKNS